MNPILQIYISSALYAKCMVIGTSPGCDWRPSVEFEAFTKPFHPNLVYRNAESFQDLFSAKFTVYGQLFQFRPSY